MSTPCGIAIKTEDGYKTIYCHHDGYPEYMWHMLTDYYNTWERAEALISFGDASSISERIMPSQDFNHSFDKPEPRVCVFYHRDRGEDWHDVEPECYTKSYLFKHFYFVYIFEDGCWHLYKGGTEAIC